MSTAPLARSADLSRLLDDGYEVVIEGGHLVVRHIPYVSEAGDVLYGFLTYPVTVSGDTIVSGTDHRIWFGGTLPHTATGKPLGFATPELHSVTESMQASFMLSSKPGSEGYADEYSKVTAYADMLAHPAYAIDPSATATPGASWTEVPEDSPFAYRDTATTRAGLAALSNVFKNEKVVIVGVGGTGSYILDLVAKTPVSSITLIDGDPLENHNAFRAPGAVPLDTLRSRPKKVDYFAAVYSNMHRNVIAHGDFLDESNLHLLSGATFVFLASDDPQSKTAVVAWLENHGLPFIDVGMGVDEVDGKLTGLLRVVTSLPNQRGHIHRRNLIPNAAAREDDYGRNIQIADLNALNAALAVVRWKRHLGFYADGTVEGSSTYSLFVGDIASEGFE